jgi:hypothetical protein
MWGLVIANNLDQSLWSTNQKYWSNLLHYFLEVCCGFHQPRQPARIWCRKTIFLG